MAFWDTVKADLKKAVEEGWTVVKDGARVAAEKSEEVAKTGKLRYKAHVLHKDVEKIFADLGGRIFDLANGPSKKDPLSNPEVKRLIEEIRALENETKLMNKDLVDIKNHKKKGSPKASTAPKVVENVEAKKSTVKTAVKKKVVSKKKAVKKKSTSRKSTVLRPSEKKTVKTTAKKSTLKKAATKKASPEKAAKPAIKKAAPKKKAVLKKG